MQPTVTIKRLGWLAAATIVLGVLIGVGAGLLTLLLYGVEHVLLGYIEGPELPGPFGVPAARRAISVTVGLSIAGIIWYLLRHKTTAVPSVKKAVAGKRMPFWQTIAHVVLQIFIVGSGASIGREVAPRELGAMLAQRFCDLFHIEGVDGIDRRMVVAVAAGAGLGGVYDAPLAGMFFAVEILLVDVTIEKVAFGLGMSAIAAFVAVAIKGHCLFYDITAMQPESTPTLMLFALICGAACGVGGALFRKGSQWAEAHKPTGKAILWQMTLAGLITGLVAIVVPQVMGNGRAAAQLGFSTFIPETAGTAGAMQSASSAAASPWNLLTGGRFGLWRGSGLWNGIVLGHASGWERPFWIRDERRFPAVPVQYLDVAGCVGTHLCCQSAGDADDHSLRCVGRCAAARHRIRFHAGCDARSRMDTDVSDRFGNRVCLDRCGFVAFGLTTGTAYGHVLGDGAL